MEGLSSYIGEFGRWQLFFYLVCGIAGIPGAMQIYVMTFYSPTLDHWCARPQHMRDNVSVEVWRNYSSPYVVIKGKRQKSSCLIYDIDYSNISLEELELSNVNKTRKCQSWEFDMRIYDRTMNAEFDLVCDREFLISTSNAIYMAGFMLSVMVNGHFADRYGRKKTVMINNFFLIIVSFAMAFSGSFVAFMILRGFQCFFALGMSNPSFILFTEICSGKYRAILGNLFFWGFALGLISFSGIAYLLVNWVHIQLVISAPFVPILALFWFFPESPLWLITQGRYKDAVKAIQFAAKYNKIKLPPADELELDLKKLHKQQANEDQKKYNFLDLMKYPNLRKNLFNMFFCWFVNGFVYYGLSFNTNDLGGNPFINFLISSAVEVPAYILAAISVHYMGRKLPLMICLMVGGVACATPILIPTDKQTLLIVFPMIGKFFISASFAMIYVYVAELIPTVLRNIGFGSCSMAGRFGSILAPYVKELGIYTHVFVPPAIYGALGVASSILIIFLPETKNAQIPNLPEEADTLARKPRKTDDYLEFTQYT